jgi:hypothetical protein
MAVEWSLDELQSRNPQNTKGYKHWTPEEDRLLLSLYEKVNRKEISQQLGKSKGAVSNRLLRLGIKGDTSHTLSLGRVRTTVDLDYFSEPNTHNSYWAGFIAADGNLSANRYQLTIGLAEKDASVLGSFKAETHFSGEIHSRKSRGFSKNSYFAEIRISGIKGWYIDLNNNFSITPQKTYTLRPPKLLDNDLILPYLKGLLDGDGWVSLGWNKKHNIPTLVTGFCGTRYLLAWIKNFCDSTYGAPRISQVKDFGTYSYYTLGGNRAEKFLIDCRNSVQFGLSRKWDLLSSYRIIKYGDLHVY